MCAQDQIAALRSVFPGVQRYEEGSRVYYLLLGMPMPKGCTPETVDVLFCPTERDGYPSRLYFAIKVQSRSSLNWNSEVRIIERNWFAYSWKVQQQLPLLQLLLYHLRALG